MNISDKKDVKKELIKIIKTLKSILNKLIKDLINKKIVENEIDNIVYTDLENKSVDELLSIINKLINKIKINTEKLMSIQFRSVKPKNKKNNLLDNKRKSKSL